MKILKLVILLTFLFAQTVFAIDWYDQKFNTILWDPVEKIKPTDVIKYNVYLKDTNSNEVIEYDTTEDTTMDVELFEEGVKYFFGVSAVRVLASGIELPETEITWSDNDNEVLVPNPFGARFYVPLENVKGLRM